MIVIDAGVIALLCIIVVTFAVSRYLNRGTRRSQVNRLVKDNAILRKGLNDIRDEALAWTGDAYSDLVIARVRKIYGELGE
jgi:hypothetical protein